MKFKIYLTIIVFALFACSEVVDSEDTGLKQTFDVNFKSFNISEEHPGADWSLEEKRMLVFMLEAVNVIFSSDEFKKNVKEHGKFTHTPSTTITQSEFTPEELLNILNNHKSSVTIQKRVKEGSTVYGTTSTSPIRFNGISAAATLEDIRINLVDISKSEFLTGNLGSSDYSYFAPLNLIISDYGMELYETGIAVLAHEVLHTVGFSHKDIDSSNKKENVLYAIQNIVEKTIGELALLPPTPGNNGSSLYDGKPWISSTERGQELDKMLIKLTEKELENQ